MTNQSKVDISDGSSNSSRYVTLELIRKRSEHNESMVSNLEEIALHQEELESIGPVLGRTCGRTLKILLLQNNVISQLTRSEMRPFKSLEYLNLALNNLDRIDSIDHLEFLNKLDLTLNFMDVDTLEETVDCLSQLRSLRELYLIGNPCISNDAVKDEGRNGPSQDFEAKIYSVEDSALKHDKASVGWKNCRAYVIARLDHLQILDGKEVLRSERIKARQGISKLEIELRELSIKRRIEKDQMAKRKESAENCGVIADDELIGHTPEVRTKLSREMAQQKESKEKNEKANQPKRRGEIEFEQEQQESIFRERQRKDRGEVRQCNEGKYEFRFDEETCPGYLLLDINVPRFMSSSLIDVDVNPTYISVIIKSKVLRLNLPVEVKSNESSAQRSTTTGNLLIKMAKFSPDTCVIFPRTRREQRAPTNSDGPSFIKNIMANDTPRQGQKARDKKDIKVDLILKSSETDDNDNLYKQKCIGLFPVKTNCHEAQKKNDLLQDSIHLVDSFSSTDDDDAGVPPPY